MWNLGWYLCMEFRMVWVGERAQPAAAVSLTVHVTRASSYLPKKKNIPFLPKTSNNNNTKKIYKFTVRKERRQMPKREISFVVVVYAIARSAPK